MDWSSLVVWALDNAASIMGLMLIVVVVAFALGVTLLLWGLLR